MLVWFGLVNPLFCLLKLWHIGSYRDKMRKNIHEWVKSNIRILGRRPENACRNFARWWVELYKQVLEADQGFVDESSPFLALLEELLALLNGDWRITCFVIHHCADELVVFVIPTGGLSTCDL